MGKNRKAKQVVNQTNGESEGNATDPGAPVEFLTSDDFQIVQKKKHHSKKSPDDQEEREFLPRSRTSSSRFADAEEAIGCHSGFWGVKSQECSPEDITADEESQNGAETCNGCQGVLENGGGDCLPEVCNGVEKICMNGGGAEKNEETDDEISENVFNFERPPTPHQVEGVEILGSCDENETDVRDLNQNVEPEEIASSKIVESERKDASLSLHIDGIADTDANAPDNASPGSEDADASKIFEIGCHAEKSSTKKKKEKKARDRQNSDGSATSQKAGKVLTNSSSSDFSEVHAVSNDEDHESKGKDEREKRDRKRPSKKQLAAIHDALMKAKDEEERRRQEEEAQRKLAEEAEKQAQERQRLEQEKKEKKKLKEKQKRERLKSEGRLLSKSQKQSRARLAATLEAFRQQGVDVPQIGEKRPRGPPMDKSNRKRLDSSQSDSGIVSKLERHKSESLSSQESGKESLSDLPSSFDSKESWDINDFRAAEGMTTESDAGHFSCSEESDAIDEDHRTMYALPKPKDAVEKSNLAKPKSNVPDTSSSEEKKDSATLRSPVICVLGHVDTGKTKLLDFIRKTHVQDSEAGGITQQIGATMIPQDALKEKCKMVKNFASFQLKVPGLLVIDTPGHESFRNLRSRGTSVCDIAILVVDVMHGLEPQTLESIDLLKKSKIPFVVALNKIDRIYGWKSSKDEDIQDVINKQNSATLMEFRKRYQDIILQFANQCLNAVLFYENPDTRTFVSMVPISAITGDGMGNLLSLIAQLTQSLLRKRLTFSQELQATVLEVKVISGLGTTIDVILVNGRLQEGDTIVLVGHEGPVVTQIRSLLMPRPLKELRVKNPYIEYKSVEGAQGVKLTGKDFDKTIAGMPLFVAKNQSEIEHLKSEVTELLNQTVSNIRTSERGVFVLASTLGSLEALLDYLASASIPYVGVKVGPVVKRDVMKASIMLEHDKLYATILAFDVKIDKDAQELADSVGVKIFSANIIYHLFDMFVKYREEFDKKRDEARHHAVFPCILKVLPSDAGEPDGSPLVLDVLVEAGSLRQYTPLCVSTKSNLELGIVSAVEVDKEYVACAKEGQRARITVEAKGGDPPKAYGSHFDDEDYLISRVTRQSIEVCKEHYRDELNDTDWHLMSELKKMLHLHA